MIKKIQLSATRVLPEVTTVWIEHGPEVDLVMKLPQLTFAPDSLETIYAFHVLDHLFPEEAGIALKNWYGCLQPKGELIIVVDDFEYVTRSFISGDISIDEVNERHNHPMQFTPDNLIGLLKTAGWSLDNVVIWYQDFPNVWKKEKTELIFQAKKIL